ncbi:glycosyltransferase family 4 protein [Flammeovirga sp. MY04]|uniref:glycosyltransferase family 4 protein n=1 Tax=Flammeovirga sp. MY04 TaxID=1191459 RepID=UPI0009FE4089|nr:glycosyltransferase family 1 protein [Flammeovirga sp. MY04]ANQ52089.2 glycosyltransferase family 4 protein [Flammeovirga sp. MY04]
MKNSMQIPSDITLACCQHFNSGIGRYSYMLGESLRELKSNVKLYKVYKPNHTDVDYHKHKWIKKIPYRSFKGLHSYILPYFIHQKIKSTPKDQIIHGHWFLSGLAASYTPNPVVVTMHDVSLLHITEADKWFTGYYKWAINRFKERRIPIIVVSNNAKMDTIKYANYPEELIYVSKGFLNFNQFFYDDTVIKDKDKFTIIYTGGLGGRKNVGLLLHAMKVIEKKYPHVFLKIAGAHPEYTNYPAIAKELGLQNIEFSGFIPDEKLNQFYNEADLFVFTSLYEGFGYTPLEAMATKLPVISTKGGSLTEIVGKGGTLVEYNVMDMIEKITHYIENEKERKQQAELGYEWVKQYTRKNSLEETIKAYNFY